MITNEMNVFVSNSKITAADLAGDGVVKIITIDTSANVICYNKEGTKLWESVISGTSSPGSRLYDVDKDGTTDIIITTDDGSALLIFLQIALENVHVIRCHYVVFIRIFKTARGTEQSSCTYCTVRTIYLSDVMIIDKIVMYDPHIETVTIKLVFQNQHLIYM